MISDLVSVILPVYNVEKYINEAVDSVINQTYKNIEIILVDDGSPDTCGKICDKYSEKDRRIKVIHKKNGGLSSARNAGISMASGQWIYFMDSDDWIELDTIEKTLYFAIKNSCDMCIFDLEYCNEKSHVHEESLKHKKDVFIRLEDQSVFLAYACAPGYACTYIAKASIIKELKFDENFSVYEDQTFKWELYGKIKSFCYIGETLYHYRYVPSSLGNTSDLGLDIRIKNYNRMYKIGCDIVRTPQFPENAVKAVHSKYLESFFYFCSVNFESKEPLLVKIRRYKKYINSDEFKESIEDFSDLYFHTVLKICLKRKKAPHWILVYILVKIRTLKNRLRI